MKKELKETPKQNIKKDKSIQGIMNEFYKINPGLNFGNKTSRLAAQWLVDKYTLEGTIEMIEMMQKFEGDKYCPVATTPYEFKTKLGKIRNYMLKKQKEQEEERARKKFAKKNSIF